MFANKHKKLISVSELDNPFHEILNKVQKKYAHIIPNSVKIEEVYSTYRLLQRGARSEGQNTGIPEIVCAYRN